MPLSLPIFQLIFSMISLLLSTQIFIRLVVKLAQHVRLSPLVIGTTVVAIGTSLPEITIASIGVIHHDNSIALGNVLGSNIINCLFITGIAVLMGDLRVGTTKTQRNAALTLFTGLTFIVLYLSAMPAHVLGMLLLGSGIVYSIVEYQWGIKGRKFEDLKAMLHIKRPKFTLIDSLFLMGAIIAVVICGQIATTAVENVSILLKLNTRLLGMTLVAAMTTMPELITTIVSQRQHQAKVAMGNILGSNLYNLFIVAGIALTFGSKIPIRNLDWSMYAAAMLACVVLVHAYSGRIIPKVWGFVFIGGYILYIVVNAIKAGLV